MEVTHIEDSQNHVVLGGGQSRSFAIATTAEFVTVLSDALYSDKELAVAREVICNAWDSHISSGITHKAISINLTESELIIRDFGAGIPDDLIEEIYCTYGESTKRTESATTGGFGLGSKSPFAISETFSVISYHNGKQTTYAISKGSLATDGLPELRNIVTLPTIENGVKVSIPVGDKRQAIALYRAITKVIRNGGIKADFTSNIDTDYYHNGRVNSILTMDKAEDGYIITSYDPYKGEHNVYGRRGLIFVQYGTVIYPVESHDLYEESYKFIKTKIASAPHNNIMPTYDTQANIIIKAKDSSLSVAPSREALSYNKTCVNALKDLLKDVADKLNEVNFALVHQAMKEHVDKSLKDTDPSKYNTEQEFLDFILNFERNFKIYHKRDNTSSAEEYTLYTKKGIHFNFLSAKYKLPTKAYSTYVEKRVYAKLKNIKQSFWAKQFKKYWLIKRHYNQHTHFTINFMYNLRKKFLKDLYDKYGREIFDSLLHTNRDYSSLEFATHCGIHDKTSYRKQPYTTNFQPYKIIIAHNRTSVKNWKGFDRNDMLYSLILPKSQKKFPAKDVADFLETMGYKVYRVYDMEAFQPYRAPRTTSVDPLAPPKPKANRKGYALLSATLTPHHHFDHNLFSEAERTEEPEAVVSWSTCNYVKHIDGFGSNEKLELLVEYFPKTVVASSIATHRNIRDKFQIKDALLLIKEKLKTMIVDPDFIRFHALKDMLIQHSMYKLLTQIPDIASEFGFSIKANKYSDRDYTLYATFKDTLAYTETRKLEADAYAIKTEVTDDMGNFDKYLDAAQYIEFIDHMSINTYNNLDAPSQDVFKNIIRVALKG